MEFVRFFSCVLCFVSMPVLATQLTLSVTNTDGNAIKDAVAALVPEKPVDYTSIPTAIIDQREKMFVPGVLAIRLKTQVRFPNSDDIRHHVYSFSPAKKFELRLYHGLTVDPVLFDKPGTVVLGCNIHDSMVAYIYVVETDLFAVSNEQGKIQISAPPGKYQLQIYHPQMSGTYPESSITLGDAPMQQNIVLDNLSPPKPAGTTDEFSNLF